MVRFTISAPGKVILHGEHAVVYGKRALATSLGLRTYLTLSTSKTQSTGQINLNFASINLTKTFNVQEQIKPLLLQSNAPIITATLLTDVQYTHQLSLLQAFLSPSHHSPTEHNALLSFLFLLTCILAPADLTRLNNVILNIEVSTELTVSAGLGSSASFLVCVAGALCCFRKYRTGGRGDEWWGISEDDLNEFSNWAFNAERIIHGTPSGVDNTICTFGALVEFRKGFPPISIAFPKDCGAFKLNALLINTRVPKDTKKMVASVAQLKQKYPNIVGHILDAIDETTASALSEFKQLSERLAVYTANSTNEIADDDDIKQSVAKLEQLFPLNHHLLSALGVSHPALDHACTLLAAHGIKAKLTGAGGGGYAIALVPAPLYSNDVITAALRDLIETGYEGRLIELGGRGVKVEVHRTDGSIVG